MSHLLTNLFIMQLTVLWHHLAARPGIVVLCLSFPFMIQFLLGRLLALRPSHVSEFHPVQSIQVKS